MTLINNSTQTLKMGNTYYINLINSGMCDTLENTLAEIRGDVTGH